jgi:hypothetical protein
VSSITVYNSAGKIVKVVLAPPDMLDMQVMEGEFGLYGDSNIYTQYVDEGVVVDRPTQLTALDKLTLISNGTESITIASAPSGTFTATNTTTRETVTGPISGTDTFSTTVPGTYKIRIESWPYLDFETTITAVAP